MRALTNTFSKKKAREQRPTAQILVFLTGNRHQRMASMGDPKSVWNVSSILSSDATTISRKSSA